MQPIRGSMAHVLIYILMRGKKMEDRRSANRMTLNVKSQIVDCTTQERYDVVVENVSPVGMGIRIDADAPNLVGRDIIIMAESLIMYAEVMRQVEQEDGSFMIGISAKRFTGDVLDYLYNKIDIPEDR